MRQLESQKEDIDNQKILVQQILSKYPTQVIIKLEESKGLNDRWTVSKLRQSLQRYITIYTNAQQYEVNTRSTHFSTSNKRCDKSDAFRPVKDSTDHISAEALVTILMFRIKGRRFGRQLDLVFTAKVIILMIVASNILMFLLGRNNYKSKEDVLFALELVTFPKSV